MWTTHSLSLRGGNEVTDAAIHRVSKDAYRGCGSVTEGQWIATRYALAMTNKLLIYHPQRRLSKSLPYSSPPRVHPTLRFREVAFFKTTLDQDAFPIRFSWKIQSTEPTRKPTRKPRLLLRLLGVLLLRLAERKFVPSLFQEPPRLTRFEPDALVLRPKLITGFASSKFFPAG